MKKEKKSAGSLGFVDTVEGRRELISTKGGIVAAPVDNVIDLGTRRRVGRFLVKRIEDLPEDLMRQLVAERTAPPKRATALQNRIDARAARRGELYLKPRRSDRYDNPAAEGEAAGRADNARVARHERNR